MSGCLPALLALFAACGGGGEEYVELDVPPEVPFGALEEEDVPDLAAMSETERHAWLMDRGEHVYDTGGSSGVACVTCHMEHGRGEPPTFPPLVGQRDLMGDCAHQAGLILLGMEGDLEVDGIVYNGVMPPQDVLSDAELAAVITYARNTWGNDYGPCLPADVVEGRSREPTWQVSTATPNELPPDVQAMLAEREAEKAAAAAGIGAPEAGDDAPSAPEGAGSAPDPGQAAPDAGGGPAPHGAGSVPASGEDSPASRLGGGGGAGGP